MTTNGQLNDACFYQIIPTNFTCNMDSGFRPKKCFCQHSQILIIVEKCYQKNKIWINIKTKTVRVAWECASVYYAFQECITVSY